MVSVASASTTTTILFNEKNADAGFECTGNHASYPSPVTTEWSAFGIIMSNTYWYADELDPFLTKCGISPLPGSEPGIVQFNTPVDSVTVDWWTFTDLGADPTFIYVEAYGASNNLLGSFSGTGSGTNNLTGPGISYIKFHDAGGFNAISDLTFTVGGTEIPEFPTVALPVVGVIGMMFLFLRRKHTM